MTGMKYLRTLAIVALAAVGTVSCTKATPVTSARPVVVELFTSQGCSSCPPAQDVLNKLADRPDVLALSFGVVYWDYLGWKDTFGSQAFTQRQYDYAKGLHHAGVFTPQMVIDGLKDTTGQSAGQVEPLIAAAKAHAGGPAVKMDSGHVTVAAGTPVTGGEVWLVRYDPRTVQVPIQRGENSGRTLPHRNVVRQLVKLGPWTGHAVDYALPKGDAGLKTAVLVQAGTGGPIVGAAG